MRLSSAPLQTLVNLAKEQGAEASLAHDREELLDFLLDDEELRPDPIRVVRGRLHALIARNLSAIEDGMDDACLACHRAGQSKCMDIRVIAEYLQNIQFLRRDIQNEPNH